MKLLLHQYGKACVRVMKVSHHGAQHSIKELEVSVMLQGDFEASYTSGDNRLLIPTETMENIVKVLAKEKLGAENELFGIALGEHILAQYPQVGSAEIRLSEHCWQRLRVGGHPHNHAFVEQSSARPFARVIYTREARQMESGIDDLLIIKTTGSGFEGFVKDALTTLPEIKDRVFATNVKAAWTFEKDPPHYSETNALILEAMLSVFANNYSPSVQTTLAQMGEAALAAAPEISHVSLVMPNKHCLLIDLAPFGLENPNELFVPTNEPHGQVEATVSR